MQVLNDYDKHTEENPKHHYYETAGETPIDKFNNEDVRISYYLKACN